MMQAYCARGTPERRHSRLLTFVSTMILAARTGCQPSGTCRRRPRREWRRRPRIGAKLRSRFQGLCRTWPCAPVQPWHQHHNRSLRLFIYSRQTKHHVGGHESAVEDLGPQSHSAGQDRTLRSSARWTACVVFSTCTSSSAVAGAARPLTWLRGRIRLRAHAQRCRLNVTLLTSCGVQTR